MENRFNDIVRSQRLHLLKHPAFFMRLWTVRLVVFIATFSYSSSSLRAQLCSGTLGTPAVFIDFGTSSSIGSRSPLGGSDGNTSYRFAASGITRANDYAIAPQSGPSVGFYRLWHDEPDHTPNDQLGNMMILDLNTAGITIYSKAITTGLCANTTYEFSAWMASLIKPEGLGIDPDVTFIVRDNRTNAILATINSGPLVETNTINWLNKGVMFTTGNTTGELLLEIVCNSSGTAGNDLAIDDISFRPCLTGVSAFFSGGSGSDFCEGSTAVLNSTITSGNYNNPVYQWQSASDGVNWVNIPAAVNTSYTISNVSAIHVNYYRLLTAEKGNLNATCSGSSNQLQLNLVPAIQMALPASLSVCQSDSFIDVPVKIIAGTANHYNITSDLPGISAVQNSFSATQPLRLLLPPGTVAGTYRFTIAVNDSNFNCGIATGTFNVVVVASPDIVATNTAQSICSGEMVLPVVPSNPNGIATQAVTWTRSHSSLVTGISANGTGTISGRLINTTDTLQTVVFTMLAKNAACSSEVKAFIMVAPSLRFSAGPDTVLPSGITVNLSGRGTQNLTYYWTATPAPIQGSGLQTLSPSFVLSANTRFVLTATSSGQCTQSDTMQAKVLQGPDIYVPSGFVPNGVSNTNGFAAIPVGIQQFYFLRVFNRWGQLMFETSDSQKGWDGRLRGVPQPMGVYVWMTSGKTGTGAVIQKRGTVTLIR